MELLYQLSYIGLCLAQYRIFCLFSMLQNEKTGPGGPVFLAEI